MDTSLSTVTTEIRTKTEDLLDNSQRELKGQNETAGTESAAPVQKLQQEPNSVGVALEKSEANSDKIKTNKDAEQHKLAENKAVEVELRGTADDAFDIAFKNYVQLKLIANHSENMKIFDNAQIPKDDNSNVVRLLNSSRDASVISTHTHTISELPPEILLRILRWVVSAELDMHSLEQCAAVCKGLYLCARYDELWRLACAKVWGSNLGNLGEIFNRFTRPIFYATWRQMFIWRERVLCNGCYISKTKYLRRGENSFEDKDFQPILNVEYYRYVRFLADGRVFMMTDTDEPAQGVQKLKNIHQLQSEVLRGKYRLCGDTIKIILKKQQQEQSNSSKTHHYARHRHEGTAPGMEQKLYTKRYIEFHITHTTKRRNARLLWLSYRMIQRGNDGKALSQVELTKSNYPPLWFSPVRSYHLDTDAPLS